VKKPKTDKLVFDIRAARTVGDKWRVLAISADATLVDLHLALLGAFEWTGNYSAIEGAYRFSFGGQPYESGRGSRTALRKLLPTVTAFEYQTAEGDMATHCDVLRAYEVPSRRHFPKVLAADVESDVRSATWQAQSAMRREYGTVDAQIGASPRPTQTTPAYRHGFFSAVIGGPPVMPMEWLDRLFEAPTDAGLKELNAGMRRLTETYNEVATELMQHQEAHIERVVALCVAGGLSGQGLIDWYLGYRDAMSLRPTEWQGLIASVDDATFFTPLSAMEDMLETPHKRSWLQDAELQRNLSRAFGILSSNVWALWRQRPASLVDESPRLQPSRKAEATHATPTVHRLKITLRGVKPAIWRRVEIASDTTLPSVSHILLSTMGWSATHLHQFVVGRTCYGEPDPDFPSNTRNERGVSLAQIAPNPNARFMFDYDFGDGWQHAVIIEAIVSAEPDAAYPRCTGGARACPPEDCGGPYGYRDLLEAIADPSLENHASMLNWLDRPFDPEAFDVEEVNEALRPMRRGMRNKPIAKPARQTR